MKILNILKIKDVSLQLLTKAIAGVVYHWKVHSAGKYRRIVTSSVFQVCLGPVFVSPLAAVATGSTTAISCNAGPSILTITPDLAAFSGNTVLRIAAGYFAQAAPACGGAWCRIAPFRLACVFNFTIFVNTGNGPQWRSQLWLSNTTRQVQSRSLCTLMTWIFYWLSFSLLTGYFGGSVLRSGCYLQNSDGSWSPIVPTAPLSDKYTGPVSEAEAVSCSLPSAGSAAYRCLACKAPAASSLLQHDWVAARGNKPIVTVTLAFASETFQVCTDD